MSFMYICSMLNQSMTYRVLRKFSELLFLIFFFPPPPLEIIIQNHRYVQPQEYIRYIVYDTRGEGKDTSFSHLS